MTPPFVAVLFSIHLFAVTYSPPPDDGAAAAGAALFGGCWLLSCLGFLVPIGLWIAAWLFVAIWVTKDAKARQSSDAQLVTVLTWIPFTWVIGLIVHLVTRPKGNLLPCPSCQKKRLEGSAVCPHCGQP